MAYGMGREGDGAYKYMIRDLLMIEARLQGQPPLNIAPEPPALTVLTLILAIILLRPQVSLLGNVGDHVRSVRGEPLGLVFESHISKQGRFQVCPRRRHHYHITRNPYTLAI